jgi:hypothetical protein
VSYRVMDMLDMKLDVNSVDIVIDKGAFDALCSDQKKQTR